MSRKTLFLGIFIILLIFLPGYAKFQQLAAKNRRLQAEIERIKKENAELAQQVKRLQKDPLYIEKKARDKMGVGKKGEIRYRVIDENEGTDKRKSAAGN